MTVKLQTEHHFEFLSLKGGCRGSSESTLVKMPHCWKLHVTAYIQTALLTLPCHSWQISSALLFVEMFKKPDSLYCKQGCSLIWVHIVCIHELSSLYCIYAADVISRQPFQGNKTLPQVPLWVRLCLGTSPIPG